MAKKVIPKTENLPSKPESEQRVDEKISKPGKFEITDDENFTVKIPVKTTEKRWVVIENEKQADETHEVVFRMWSYEEEIQLRKEATTYDAMKRMHFVDNDKLNRLKLQTLLKSWSFEKDNPRLKILHVNGTMVDEVWKMVMKLHPNILRYIIDRMNNVLEYNG